MTDPIQIPAVHEEPVSSVLRAMQLRPLGTDSFEADSLPQTANRIYGGQVLAQALLAASATIEDSPSDPRLPNSFHAYFMRVGDNTIPVSIDVDRLRDGHSFSTCRVDVIQREKVILTMTSSFQKVQPDLSTQIQMPDVPEPEDVPNSLEMFRDQGNPVSKYLGKTAAFEMRHVAGSLYFSERTEPLAKGATWIRPRGAKLPSWTPQSVHRALLAYVSDQFMLEPVIRSNGLTWRTPGMAVASLDHAMWFYRSVDINDWHLFVQESPTTWGSRGLGITKVFNSTGRLVAVAAQEGMIRSNVPTGDWVLPEPPLH